MRRLIQSAAAFSAAFLTLLLLAGAVRAVDDPAWTAQTPSSTSVKPDRSWPAAGFRSGSSSIQSVAVYSMTRIVTITVGTAAPLGLSSRWQVDISRQDLSTGSIRLPPDASAIAVTMVNGSYSIDYVGRTIYYTNSQGMYYEYQTNQQALRFGNQILISQTYKFNYPLHYVGTVIFASPYRYVGYEGYAPAQVDATRLHWDESFTGPGLHQFEAAAWLVDPAALPRPDLVIDAARVVARRLNHVYVTATIHNDGSMAAGAPAFVNVYDRPTASMPPTVPLDLAGGWCTLDPVTLCGGSTSNRLPAIPLFESVNFTAEFDLSPTSGPHYIYLYVDALGAAGALDRSSGVGLNYESAEDNNSIQAEGDGLVWYKSFVFLPLMRRG
jgi:hypothetical protein